VCEVKIKGKKATVSITLPPELVKKAREYGLNISKIAENALKNYLERLEGLKRENDPQDNPISYCREEWWAGPDLNQRPLARKANVLPN
jgi:hypothetical protein